MIRAGNRPLVPEQSCYLPAEESSGPAGEPVDDAMSKWMYEPDPGPIAARPAKLEKTRNTQAKSFKCRRVRRGLHRGSAKKYYAAHDTFWKKDAPEFHENVYREWYERFVLPALGA